MSGKYCAGKSTVGDWLQSQGALNIEADQLGHAATELARSQIVARFGDDIVRDGKIDRKLLAGKVFGNPAALADLEAIIHPVVIAAIETRIANRRLQLAQDESISPKGKYAHLILINAALLFKSGLQSICDVVIWVDSPWWLRLWRGLRRDGRGFFATLALMRSQKALGPQHHRPNADIIKVYNVFRRCTRTRVGQILERYNG